VRALPRRDIEKVIKIDKRDDAVLAAVALFQNEVTALAECSVRPDVIICALPTDLIQKIVNQPDEQGSGKRRGSRHVRRGSGLRDIDFRDLLKAKTVGLGIPLQLVWPTTWGNDAKIERVLKKHAMRTVQDPATRHGIFFPAVYYKAGTCRGACRAIPRPSAPRSSASASTTIPTPTAC
jgi:hypothetical protein